MHRCRCVALGIFTSISGSCAQPHLQHRMAHLLFHRQRQLPTYELRLYEGQTRFDVIYGTVDQANAAQQRECRKTTPRLTSTSATAQVARLLAGKAIS